jgi:hypothetical protein
MKNGTRNQFYSLEVILRISVSASTMIYINSFSRQNVLEVFKRKTIFLNDIIKNICFFRLKTLLIITQYEHFIFFRHQSQSY